MTHLRRQLIGLGIALLVALPTAASGRSTPTSSTPPDLAVERIASYGWYWSWATTTTARPTTTTTRAPTTTTTVATTTTRAPTTTTTKAPTSTTTAPASTTGGLSAATQADLVAQVNAKRSTGTTCGGVAYPRVPALTHHATIARAAEGHAVDMATRNYFSHTGLDGSTPGTRLTAAGYRWSAYGENIAAGQPTPTSVITAWFNSAGHCRNFMSATVTQIGFGRATSSTSTYGIYWVADLARPAA